MPKYKNGQLTNWVELFGGALVNIQGRHENSRVNAGTLESPLLSDDEVLPNIAALFTDREEPASAYYVQVCIQGVRTDALVDTGACVTLVSEDFFQSIPNLKLEPSVINLEGIATGSRLDVRGVVHLAIKIGNFISEKHEILIVRGISQSCLLGMNFLDRFGVAIDTTKRCLSVPASGGRHDVPVKLVNLDKGHKVVSVAKVQVPPRSGITLEVSVRDLHVDLDGCVEMEESSTANFLVPRSLHRVRKGLTHLDCLNITDEPIVIERGQSLAKFQALTVVQSCSMVDEQTASLHSPTPDVSSMFDLSETDLSVRQKQIVYALLDRNSQVIGTSEFDLGVTGTVEHKIELLEDAPVKQPYRRFPAPLQKELREEIDKLLDMGVIEPSNSAWSSPLVPVRKKNGKLRMCIVHRLPHA